MKRSLLALIAASALSTAFAQGQPPGPPDSSKLVERLAVVLDLDDYQKTEVKKVLDAERTKMEAQRAELKDSSTRPSFEEMKAKRDEMQKETKEALSSVLTADQLKKYEAFMADGGGMPPGGPRGFGSDK